ncbi:2-keto-4-pentenoate hydratase [Herbaspirillum lusitanum]|uniref:2-keto-4-pentenoate hydratase n=1 Tax=Herbaspirillum lusitanum TaxID=213312 RepID=UPI00031C2EF3|nr:fumarylacetoacetate hydrolase family protein [Herbaspirillum lusitanum]
MNPVQAEKAADALISAARAGKRLDGLPAECRPESLADGYAVQAIVARKSGRRIAGWKIAATSVAGQRHIGVDGPIAARLLSEHVVGSGLGYAMGNNAMRCAEAEFAFRMAQDLAPRKTPYTVDEVMAAVGHLHPAVEIPDSRYADFAKVGAAQLIADAACGLWLATGPAAADDWRKLDLVSHEVVAYRNGAEAGRGTGRNVLGDPRVALAWLANELNAQGEQLRSGDLVTTGACVPPMDVNAGDAMHVDFGVLGVVDVHFY